MYVQLLIGFVAGIILNNVFITHMMKFGKLIVTVRVFCWDNSFMDTLQSKMPALLP